MRTLINFAAAKGSSDEDYPLASDQDRRCEAHPPMGDADVRLRLGKSDGSSQVSPTSPSLEARVAYAARELGDRKVKEGRRMGLLGKLLSIAARIIMPSPPSMPPSFGELDPPDDGRVFAWVRARGPSINPVQPVVIIDRDV